MNDINIGRRPCLVPCLCYREKERASYLHVAKQGVPLPHVPPICPYGFILAAGRWKWRCSGWSCSRSGAGEKMIGIEAQSFYDTRYTIQHQHPGVMKRKGGADQQHACQMPIQGANFGQGRTRSLSPPHSNTPDGFVFWIEDYVVFSSNHQIIINPPWQS